VTTASTHFEHRKETPVMSIAVHKVRIGVQDQERAKRFWVDTIGCEVGQDELYGDERWLEVRLPDPDR
jgi:catechol 2,3-dioxygenase-like lactoylglutathione lyase family enzyme